MAEQGSIWQYASVSAYEVPTELSTEVVAAIASKYSTAPAIELGG